MPHPCRLMNINTCAAIVLAGFLAATAVGSDVFEGDSVPKRVLEKGAGEGPAWHPKLGLLFSGDNRINRLNREGKLEIYRHPSGSNGLMFDAQGRLVICEAALRRITRLDKEGNVEILADLYGGKHFNQPNDLTHDAQGRIYFSDPQYGDRDGMELFDMEGRLVEGVYRIDPSKKIERILTHEVDRPNGLIISADDKFLFVADNNNSQGGARKLFRFDLKADGTVKPDSQKLIHNWGTSRGPDGMKLDQAGRLYVAGGLNRPNPPHETTENKGGIYVFSPTGNLLEFVHINVDEVTNCAFGDDDLKTLYVTAGGTLWSLRTKSPGYVRWLAGSPEVKQNP